MRIRNLVGAAVLMVGTLGAVLVYAGFGDVVSSFPHPGGVGLYGLAWDGSYLWFAGQPASVFLRTNTTGSIVGSFDIGATYTYIRGLTFDGAYLWYSSRDTVGYTYYRITTTGSFVSDFGVLPTFGPGVAWEGPYLWCGPAKVTTGGSFVASFRRPFKMETDQGWYGHKLWLGGPGNHMYNVTTGGSVAASFPVPGGGAAEGTAFDGEYLWVINRDNKWVYRIDIDVVGVDPASMGKVKAIYR
jgi:hypothetical protein